MIAPFKAASQTTRGCIGDVGGFMPVAFWPTQLLAMPKIEWWLLCTMQASSRWVD